jgi:hypothetical protein
MKITFETYLSPFEIDALLEFMKVYNLYQDSVSRTHIDFQGAFEFVCTLYGKANIAAAIADYK